jgi:hypothetical protein
VKRLSRPASPRSRNVVEKRDYIPAFFGALVVRRFGMPPVSGFGNELHENRWTQNGQSFALMADSSRSLFAYGRRPICPFC